MDNETVAQPGTVSLSTVVEPGTVNLDASGGGRVPLNNQEPAPKPEAPLSVRDVLKQEKARLDAEDAKAENDAKAKAAAATEDAKAKVEKARGDGGKFVTKDQPNTEKVAEAASAAKSASGQSAEPGQSEGRASRYDAPARFNDQGKAEWANAPESVQAEVHRTIKNLEDGYAKHRESAERWERVRQFDDIARQNGREGIHQSLQQITEFEQTMMRNPIEGFEKVAKHFGLNLQAIAAHIAGKPADQQSEALYRENQELKAQIAMGRRTEEIGSFIKEFQSQQGRERFQELAPDIMMFLKTMVKDGTADERLSIAYDLADRLKPAKANASSAAAKADDTASSAATASPAKTSPDDDDDGAKSIRGAPNGGEDPPEKVVNKDIKALLREEMRALRAS